MTGIYLSAVCLAAEFKPLPDALDSNNELKAQTELYTLLKGISHRAMDQDLMRPTVGFIKTEDDEQAAKKLLKWEADQDWHQGDFILYVRSGNRKNVTPDLEELLDDRPEVLKTSWQTGYDARHFLDKLKDSLPSFSEEEKSLFERVDKAVSGNVDGNDDIRAVDLAMDHWEEGVDSAAKRAGGL